MTDKIATPPMFKALSADWQKEFLFYTIKDDPAFGPLKETFGIKQVPSIMLWSGDDALEIYGGSLKIGHIAHWLKGASKAAKAKGKPAKETKGKDEL
jgi:hypothetical protein